jgi:hypothetical protein
LEREKTMEIFEVAIIIAISAALNIALTLFLLKLVLWKLNLKPLISMARRYAGSLGEKSQAVQHNRKLIVKNKITEQKMVDGILGELPFGNIIKRAFDKMGIGAGDVADVMQDENFVKGIIKLIQVGGGLVGKITGKEKEQVSSQAYSEVIG